MKEFSEFSDETKAFLNKKAEEFVHTFESWGRDMAEDSSRLRAALRAYLDRRISDLKTVSEQVKSGALTISDSHNRPVRAPIPMEFKDQWMNRIGKELDVVREELRRLQEMTRK